MKKQFLSMVAFAAILAACQNDAVESIALEQQNQNFAGSFKESASRVYLGEDNYYQWEEGDEVSIFTIDNRNRKYKAKSGDVVITDFEFVSKPENAGPSLTEMKNNYAIFPYKENNAASFVTGTYYTLSSTLDAEQVYREDKVNLNHAIMVSKIPASDKTFEFKNSCSLVKVNINTIQDFADEVTIESITLKSASHALAGPVTIEVEKDDYTAKIYDANGGTSDNVVLTDCEKAGTIGTDYTTFYLVIPAGTYESGDLTITVNTSSNALDKEATLTKGYSVDRSEFIELKTTLGEDGFEGTFYAYTEEVGKVTLNKDIVLHEQALMASSELASLGFSEPNSLLDIPSTDYTIDGNGKTLTFTATDGNKMAINTFVTTNGGTASYNKVTINDLTITGDVQSNMLGIYKQGSDIVQSQHQTELNNVKFVNVKAASLSENIGAAVCVYGTAVLNNCESYGVTRTSLETEPNWPLYDLAVVNYTNTTLKGGKYGSIYTWTQCKLVIDNAEVESISGAINGRENKDYGLYIKGTSEVGSINLNEAGSNAIYIQIKIESQATVETLTLTGENIDYSKIEIEEGATVNKIVVNDEEMTLAEFNELKSEQ